MKDLPCDARLISKVEGIMLERYRKFETRKLLREGKVESSEHRSGIIEPVPTPDQCSIPNAHNGTDKRWCLSRREEELFLETSQRSPSEETVGRSVDSKLVRDQ